MYIKTNSAQYPCAGYQCGPVSVSFVLPDSVPETLGETVELWAEDGFLMASQRVADCLRWEVSGNCLILTNAPETPTAPEPEPAPPTELEQLRADVDYLSAMTGVMLV